eukprot:2393121-Pyramimonas_sp.AAC.1
MVCGGLDGADRDHQERPGPSDSQEHGRQRFGGHSGWTGPCWTRRSTHHGALVRREGIQYPRGFWRGPRYDSVRDRRPGEASWQSLGARLAGRLWIRRVPRHSEQ